MWSQTTLPSHLPWYSPAPLPRSRQIQSTPPGALAANDKLADAGRYSLLHYSLSGTWIELPSIVLTTQFWPKGLQPRRSQQLGTRVPKPGQQIWRIVYV